MSKPRKSANERRSRQDRKNTDEINALTESERKGFGHAWSRMIGKIGAVVVVSLLLSMPTRATLVQFVGLEGTNALLRNITLVVVPPSGEQQIGTNLVVAPNVLIKPTTNGYPVVSVVPADYDVYVANLKQTFRIAVMDTNVVMPWSSLVKTGLVTYIYTNPVASIIHLPAGGSIGTLGVALGSDLQSTKIFGPNTESILWDETNHSVDIGPVLYSPAFYGDGSHLTNVVGGGSQVWTNVPGVAYLNQPSNTVALGDVSAVSVPGQFLLNMTDTNAANSTAVNITKDASGFTTAPAPIQVILTGSNPNNRNSSTFFVENLFGGPSAGATYFGNQAGSAFYGQVGDTSHTTANAATSITGYASGHDGLLVGLLGEADSSVSGTTNVGLIANSLLEGNTGVFTAAYFEVDDSSGATDPNITSAGILVDTRSSGVDSLVLRTNNGTTIAKVDRSGVVTANGYAGPQYTIKSNSPSTWPTAPVSPGDTVLVSSNGVVYALYSGIGNTWTKTNLISGP